MKYATEMISGCTIYNKFSKDRFRRSVIVGAGIRIEKHRQKNDLVNILKCF
jgi:hypothetical protein